MNLLKRINLAIIFCVVTAVCLAKPPNQNIRSVVSLGNLMYQVEYADGHLETMDNSKLYSLTNATQDQFKTEPNQQTFNAMDDFQKKGFVGKLLANAEFDSVPESFGGMARSKFPKVEEFTKSYFQQMGDKDKAEAALIALSERERCTYRKCNGDNAQIMDELLQKIERWSYSDLTKAVCQMTNFFVYWDPQSANLSVDGGTQVKAENIVNLLEKSKIFDQMKNLNCGSGNDSYHVFDRISRYKVVKAQHAKLVKDKTAISVAKNPLPECPPENAIPVLLSEFDKLQRSNAANSSYASIEVRTNACIVSFSMTKTNDSKIILQTRNPRFMSITSPIEAKTKSQIVAKLYGEEFAQLPWIKRLIDQKPIENVQTVKLSVPKTK